VCEIKLVISWAFESTIIYRIVSYRIVFGRECSEAITTEDELLLRAQPTKPTTDKLQVHTVWRSIMTMMIIIIVIIKHIYKAHFPRMPQMR